MSSLSQALRQRTEQSLRRIKKSRLKSSFYGASLFAKSEKAKLMARSKLGTLLAIKLYISHSGFARSLL